MISALATTNAPPVAAGAVERRNRPFFNERQLSGKTYRPIAGLGPTEQKARSKGTVLTASRDREIGVCLAVDTGVSLLELSIAALQPLVFPAWRLVTP